MIDFPPFTRPRGIVAYEGTQFPANMFDSLFVTLWNGVEGGQRVIRIDPAARQRSGLHAGSLRHRLDPPD